MKGGESRTPCVVLGCGFTGERVARRLLARGVEVLATSREPGRLGHLVEQGAALLRLDLLDPKTAAETAERIPAGARVLVSVPSLRQGEKLLDPGPRLLDVLDERPRRVVYLSTTGVYGKQRDVDETTLPAPASERQRVRVATEQALAAGPWETLILRPAAIYGPGRGVHRAIQEGKFRLAGEGDNYVSRIHVDDLAAIAETALFSAVTGAYPVADEEPCPSRQIAEFCAALLGTPPPESAPAQTLGETRRADRRVDGGAIRRALGMRLEYPSYRTGIPACLEEEKATDRGSENV